MEGGRTYGNHLSRHIPHTPSPPRRRPIQHIVHANPLVLRHQRIQILLEQNILRRDIRKDQIHLRRVSRRAPAHDGAHDLQHGRDARAAGDHAKVPHHVGRVHEGALGALDADGLAHGERRHVPRDVARGVGLDEQVEVARLVVARDGRVGAHDFFRGAVGLGEDGADGDVLADGEAEDRGRFGEGEAVAGRGGGLVGERGDGEGRGNVHGDIVGDDGLFLELKLLEGVGLEDLFGDCTAWLVEMMMGSGRDCAIRLL